MLNHCSAERSSPNDRSPARTGRWPGPGSSAPGPTSTCWSSPSTCSWRTAGPGTSCCATSPPATRPRSPEPTRSCPTSRCSTPTGRTGGPGLDPPVTDTTAARSGRTVTRSLEAGTEAALRDLARREGVSLFAVLAAAFGATTGRRIGREELLIGTPVAHRDLPESEHLLGFLVGTLPLRVDLTGDPPFTELAHRLAAAARRSFAHKDLPWEELPWWQPPVGGQSLPTLAHHPAGSTGSLTLRECRVSELDLPSDASRFDLTLRISEHPRQSRVRVEHDTRVVTPVEADDLVTGYLALLDSVALHPTSVLSDLLPPCAPTPRPPTETP
ncbi:condensation domain-containing protein [Kitasatospora purpeofusca]